MSANSTFQSCRHQVKSIIAALSNVVTLIGNLKFTDSITGIPSLFGTAVFLQTTHPELKSSLNITTGANVYFVNLTCGKGGAVYGYNAMMHIGAKARVVFMNNTASDGGAVAIIGGMITTVAQKGHVHYPIQYFSLPISTFLITSFQFGYFSFPILSFLITNF